MQGRTIIHFKNGEKIEVPVVVEDFRGFSKISYEMDGKQVELCFYMENVLYIEAIQST